MSEDPAPKMIDPAFVEEFNTWRAANRKRVQPDDVVWEDPPVDDVEPPPADSANLEQE